MANERDGFVIFNRETGKEAAFSPFKNPGRPLDVEAARRRKFERLVDFHDPLGYSVWDTRDLRSD